MQKFFNNRPVVRGDGHIKVLVAKPQSTREAAEVARQADEHPSRDGLAVIWSPSSSNYCHDSLRETSKKMLNLRERPFLATLLISELGHKIRFHSGMRKSLPYKHKGRISVPA